MDKNLLLAVTLSLAVYAIWFGLVEKKILPQPAQNVTTAQPAAGQKPQTGAPAAALAPKEAQARANDEETVLKTAEPASFGAATALIAPAGAAIVSWKDAEPLGVVELVENPSPGFLSAFPELSFRRDAKASGLVYSAKRSDGLVIEKAFLPESVDQLPLLKITLTNPTKRDLEAGAWTLSLGPGLGTIATEKAENPKVLRAIGLTAPQGGLDGKVEEFKPGAHPGDFRWIGVDNRYFLAAVLPNAGDFERVDSSLPAMVALTAKNAKIPAGGSHSWDLPYYIGPKGHNWLSHYHSGLERAINFGFFAQLGRFVLKMLNRLHELTGNWGWSIILLTMLIQAVLFPLTYKSLKSMAAMRRLQPEIARLQNRYSKDATKLNAEMMELYKKNGANPLGGCLPMLIQMPVFYALYNALRNAWELHGAPWIFWVHDLSAPDKLFSIGGISVPLLPLVMGAVMFVQNKLNAQQATDPTQAQMMTWMPVIFTFMFLKFPAGLVLYWLTNSVVSTLQQVALKSHFEAQAAAR